MDHSSSGLAPTSDQHFLLSFITGLYFAPDLKGGEPHKPVLQRWCEGLPPYTLNQLAGSFIDIEKVERVYNYVLKNADKSVILQPPLLHQFFQGSLPTPTDDLTMSYPQFDDLFPTLLHRRVHFENGCEKIENVVYIQNPDISFIKPGDLERLKRLTGLHNFRLCRIGAMLQNFVDDEILYNVPVQEKVKSGDLVYYRKRPLRSAPHGGKSPRGIRELIPDTVSNHIPSETSQISNATVSSPTKPGPSNEYPEPRMVFLPSFPSREVWNDIVAATKGGFYVTGTAASGTVGSSLGLVDIAESEDSYLFQVSLPGVKRNDSEFHCTVDQEGKVSLRGVITTGERTVYRYSQAFEMQSQNLCPSGPFSISFQLPGPVDPQQFSGQFGSDGILEGIVLKAKA